MNKLAIEICDLITHSLTIFPIKSSYQLRHFNWINSSVSFSYIQCSYGLSFTQETFLMADLKKALDSSWNNASFSLLDVLFLLFSALLRLYFQRMKFCTTVTSGSGRICLFQKVISNLKITVYITYILFLLKYRRHLGHKSRYFVHVDQINHFGLSVSHVDSTATRLRI